MSDAELRVAIVAPHASAEFGGESILPLHYFRQLRARGVDAYMVLHERTRPELQRILGPDVERVSFVRDLPTDKVLYFLSTLLPPRVGENTFGLLLAYTTQLRQKALLRRLVSERGVQVVHEPAPVSPRVPSIIYGLGVPVVIGPMNGGMTYPRRFLHLQKRSERWFVGAARTFTSLVNRAIPGKRRAAALLVANPRTRAALPVKNHPRVIELVENGVDFSVFRAPSQALEHGHDGRSERGNGVRLVYLGRLVDWKAVDLLLPVLAGLTDLPFELQIIGDGPERGRLEALTDGLGLAPRVTFEGFLPQAECAKRLAAADVLVLPSLYECGGAVVLEAMAMGLPVVAHRWGGPADYIDEHCGILIDPDVGPEELSQAWDRALRRLIGDAELRRRMGEAGQRRVRESFSWDKKIDRILEIYRHVLAAAPGDTPTVSQQPSRAPALDL
jgi:glycosyltransferase involved in cell wall biosynthesis